MRRIASLALVVAAAGCARDAAAPTESPAAHRGTADLSDRASYIVVFRRDVADPANKALELARAHGGTVNFAYTTALKGFAGEFSAAAIAALSRNPAVEFVEPDQQATVVTTQSNATWGLDRIDQASLPLNGTFTYTATGAGVTAYIIDTGIRYTHTEFGGRAIFGYDAISAAQRGKDCNGHGTHVSGTVGGTQYGVAKRVTLVAVRVLNCQGSGGYSGVIAGIDWVAKDHQQGNPAVANMSLGGGYSAAVNTAVDNAITDGVAFAVAAGNSSADACSSSPSSVPRAMTIAATDNTDTKPWWSNYGSCVDWFAPGVNITSAWHSTDTAVNTISGTSMASPHTAGVAALYLQANPTKSPAEVRTALVTAAKSGKVNSPGTSSPNLLLFSSY